MLKKILRIGFLSFIAVTALAATTQRNSLLENSSVKIWTTTIMPNDDLKPHRHNKPRVVVAFDDGKLEITNDQGEKHYLTLEKEHAYFLDRDPPNELHTDANLSGHPIKAIVIELK